MSHKHLAQYQAMKNDISIDEARLILKARAEVNWEALYGVKVPPSYEKYEWQKKNNKLRGEM